MAEDTATQPLHEDEEELVEAPPERLSPEERARRDAALAFVRKYGDPVLRMKAVLVDRFDETLRDEVARMGAIMIDSIGIGLAATQVGIPHRLLVYRVEGESPVNALVNPVLEWSSKEREAADEGCLSLPGVLLEVERPLHVRVRGKDEHGDETLIEASGLEARVIQHEMDHLDGVLILDHASREARKLAIRTLRERLEDA